VLLKSKWLEISELARMPQFTKNSKLDRFLSFLPINHPVFVYSVNLLIFILFYLVIEFKAFPLHLTSNTLFCGAVKGGPFFPPGSPSSHLLKWGYIDVSQ
jgi:hypothetical protein